MQQYWDERYQGEGMIWGSRPSVTAEHAVRLFRDADVPTVLVPGSGYGRNTRLFADAGFDVTGIEISPVACALARVYDPRTRVYHGDVCAIADLPPFGAVYCFNVLHLLRAEDRQAFIAHVASVLAPGGLLYFVVFSEEEASFGQGREVETGTFESKPGRPVHYFTDADLRKHFCAFDIMETGLVDDAEDHGGAAHVHRLRYLIACGQVTPE